MADENIPPPRLLLVEGKSDAAVAAQLWRRQHNGGDPPFEIEPAGGVDQLLERVEVEIDAPGRTHIGFVVDADDDLAERWSDLKGRLQLASIVVTDPSPNGVRVTGVKPRHIGIWIMPDNERSGELEDFILEMLLDNDDQLWPLAESYITQAIHTEQRFKSSKRLRAEIHAWLSVQREPSLPGAAIREGILSVTGSLARRYGKWMERVFNED